MPVVILKEFVESIKHIISPDALIKKLNSQTVNGEDFALLKLRPNLEHQKFDEDNLIISYRNFAFDKQGNITADTIKYGNLRNYHDSQIHFVVRSFVTYTQAFKLVAIDVKYG